MKIPYSWLKELIPDLESELFHRLDSRVGTREQEEDVIEQLMHLTGQQRASDYVLAHGDYDPMVELEAVFASLGLPLEGVEEAPAPIDGVVLASVIGAGPIEGTQLTKLTLDVGAHGHKTVASGAPNAVGLRPGTVVALVTPGTRLGELEYGVRQMQGVESWGMSASAKELGVGESSAGILLFPAGTAAPGTPMHEVWPADSVLDVEVTPNRADVLSALGLARDLAAFLKLELREPPAGPAAQGESEIRVSLPPKGLTLERDPSRKLRFGCDHFAARTVSGLTNGPSPLWMQRRLTLAGMRPIDLIVDTSNYVMLELGQPTALYDRRDVTEGQILVSFGLRHGEAVRDLMGGEHTVGPEDLLILDGAQPEISSVADAFAMAGEPKAGDSVLGIAGIMGGDHGHVRAETRDVVIESAHFDPVVLRRTSTRLGLKTDAVYRYERGVDPLLAPKAADRVAGLLAEAGGGTLHPGATVVGDPEVPQAITATGEQIRALLGMHVDTGEMRDILTRLGGVVDGEGDTLTVLPPSWRVDMNIWQDLAEEVARLHGYAELPETLPTLRLHASNIGASAKNDARQALRRTLAGLGFQEVVTYTFTSDEEAGKARTETPTARLQNPMTAERTGLRTALFPSLLRAAQAHPKGERTLLFEQGRIFPASGEAERLGLLMRGPLAPTTFQPGVAGSYGAFRGLVEALAGTLGAGLEVRQLRGAAVPPALHPGIAGEVVWNGQSVGWMGVLHPEIAQEFGLKGDTFILEVALPLPGRPWAFRDPSRAPAAWRDLAVIAPQEVSYGELAALLGGEAGELLESVEPFDVYSGEQVGEGRRSVAVRLIFRGQKTLTDEEVDPVMDRLMGAVRAQGWGIREK